MDSYICDIDITLFKTQETLWKKGGKDVRVRESEKTQIDDFLLDMTCLFYFLEVTVTVITRYLNECSTGLGSYQPVTKRETLPVS